MKLKKTILIVILLLLVYTGSYCCLRLSKLLVHQEVAFVNRTGFTHAGRSVCYFIHHEIGHGSFTDEDNNNAIKEPSTVTRTGRFCYYPLVKLELSYWKLTLPRYVQETVCSE